MIGSNKSILSSWSYSLKRFCLNQNTLNEKKSNCEEKENTKSALYVFCNLCLTERKKLKKSFNGLPTFYRSVSSLNMSSSSFWSDFLNSN